MKSVFISVAIFLFTISTLLAKAPEHHFGHKAGHSFSLGVLVANPDNSVLKDQHLDGGAEIIKVFDGSEAERIGLQPEDIIIKFNDKKIKEAEDLKDAVEDLEKAGDVKLTVVRDGKELVKTAHLEPQSKKIRKRMRVRVDNDDDGEDVDIDVDVPQAAVEQMMRGFTARKGGYLGVETKELSDQLKEYFQVENGVLIERVLKDSPAQKAGLKAGDVIIKINDKKINDYDDLLRTINYYDPGDKVSVYFSRKGAKKKVTVELAKKPATFPWKNMPWPPRGGEKDEYRNFRGPGHIFFHPGARFPELQRMFKEKNIEIFAL